MMPNLLNWFIHLGCGVQLGPPLLKDAPHVVSNFLLIGAELTHDDEFEITQLLIGMFIEGDPLNGVGAGVLPHLIGVDCLEADRLDQVETPVFVAERNLDLSLEARKADLNVSFQFGTKSGLGELFGKLFSEARDGLRPLSMPNDLFEELIQVLYGLADCDRTRCRQSNLEDWHGIAVAGRAIQPVDPPRRAPLWTACWPASPRRSLIVRDTRGAQSQHSPADEQERDKVHEP
jgi:hypothetical protein